MSKTQKIRKGKRWKWQKRKIKTFDHFRGVGSMSIKQTGKSEELRRHKQRLLPIWGQAAIMGVRSDRIVESLYVSEQTLLNFCNTMICPSVGLFLFQVLKEALHNSIIVGMPFCRKRLHNVQCVKVSSKGRRGKLRTSVRMEYQAGMYFS